MITIKNSNGDICDYRIPYNIFINEEIESIQKLIDECKKKMIEISGIPKDKINYEVCH